MSKCLYPSFVNNAIKNTTREAKKEFEELVKNDSPTLFRHLHVLSQYATFKPLSLPLPKEKIPTNWLESEAINYQALVGYYLSGFRSENQENHPYTLHELLKQIEVFLLMVETEINLPQNVVPVSDISRKIIVPIRKDKYNPDEFIVKNFIIAIRSKNPNLSRDSLVDKIVLAVVQEKIVLQRDYKPSTYKKWDRDVDPIKDMKKKLSRPKAKNRKE